VRRPWIEEVLEVAILATEKDCAREAKASMALVRVQEIGFGL
jgi:hypothetical protein